MPRGGGDQQIEITTTVVPRLEGRRFYRDVGELSESVASDFDSFQVNGSIFF